MKLLDALVENSFKKTDDGWDLFYPSGTFGKGRIIPNIAEKEKLKKFLKTYYLMGFGLLIFSALFKIYLLLAIGVICLSVYYCLKVKSITKHYEISPINLSAREALTKASKNYSKGFIIFGIIFGIIMILLGVISLFLIRDGLNPGVPVFFLVMGGLMFFMYLRMLHSRKKSQ